MKSVPKFMQGVYTSAMRQALDFVSLGEDRGDEELQSRAWKCSSSFQGCFCSAHAEVGSLPGRAVG